MTERIEYRSAAAYGTDLRARLCPQVTRTGAPLAPAQLDLRAETMEGYERNVVGHASVTGAPYEMYDMFGDYTETVAPGAFERTLARLPAVSHRIGHQGLGLSSTRSGTLTLVEDDIGLRFRSVVDTRETDAADLVIKLERGVASETSFAFRIVEHTWNEEYDALTINEVDIHRGDVASVCYGANPAGAHTVEAVAADAERSGWADELARSAAAQVDADQRAFWEAKWLGHVTQVAYDMRT